MSFVDVDLSAYSATLLPYVDESSDARKERVFAVAAAIGTSQEWALAEAAWLGRTGGKVFHAAECETEFAKDPDPAKHKASLALYKDLTQILVNSPIIGVSVALDLKSFHEFFPNVLPDAAYMKCLKDLIESMASNAKRFQGEKLSLEFTLDDRKESRGNAGVLYSALANEPEFVGTSVFGAHVKFDTRQNPRIQMADLLAREAMKDLDRRVSGSGRAPRLSKQALDGAGKFIFMERDRAYVKNWKERMPQLHQATGFSSEGYYDWLVRKGRIQEGVPHDTWTNKFEYFASLQSSDSDR